MAVTALDHLVLTVTDIEDTVRFYSEVLGMLRVDFHGADGTERVALSFGAQKINLHQRGAEFAPRAATPQPGSADLCFLTEVPLVKWQAHFAAQGVEIEDGPVERSGAVGPITSLYIRDPDGNLLEVSVAD